VLRGQRNGSPWSYFCFFFTGVATTSSKQLVNCANEAVWTTFQIHCFSESLVAPGIEHGNSGSVARNSDHWTTEIVKLTSVLDRKHRMFDLPVAM
jgi:hypothetical protein